MGSAGVVRPSTADDLKHVVADVMACVAHRAAGRKRQRAHFQKEGQRREMTLELVEE